MSDRMQQKAKKLNVVYNVLVYILSTSGVRFISVWQMSSDGTQSWSLATLSDMLLPACGGGLVKLTRMTRTSARSGFANGTELPSKFRPSDYTSYTP